MRTAGTIVLEQGLSHDDIITHWLTVDNVSLDADKEQTRSLLWSSEDTRPIQKPKSRDGKPSGCDFYVIVREKDDGPRWLYRLSYKHTLLIGRHFRCDIIVEDPACSRIHCELVKHAGQWQVVHKSETNPTRVNEEEVFSKFLVDGDVIRVGKTLITFYEDEPQIAIAGCCDV